VIRLPRVEAKSNETPEQLLRRFNKSVSKSRVLADVRRKRWFVSKSELDRIKRKKASRRVTRPSGPTRNGAGSSNSNSDNPYSM
jgi:small subunit ribosomal protein S21